MKVNDITLFTLSHCFNANWKRIIFFESKFEFQVCPNIIIPYPTWFSAKNKRTGLQNIPIVNNVSDDFSESLLLILNIFNTLKPMQINVQYKSVS